MLECFCHGFVPPFLPCTLPLQPSVTYIRVNNLDKFDKFDMDNHDLTLEDYVSMSSVPGYILPQPYPTPIPFSPIQYAFSQHMSTPSASGSTAPKVAIPRLTGSDTFIHGRRRAARACQPCRQRKIKCDGIRPSCGQCAYHNYGCNYEEVKRVRDQKQLGSLAKRVDTYEALLRDLEAEVDPPTARKIKKALKVCPVNIR